MRRIRGFTLIELMITIAILAVLLGLAYPAYTGYVERSRRADAISGLLQTAQQMERCFTRTNTYSGCGTFPAASPDGHYSITAPTQTATAYSLSAAPTGAQSDDDCGTFTLDHRGIKGNDPENTTDRCWGS